MPYAVLRNRDGSYRVVNAATGRALARKTTRRRAQAQVRLLREKERL